MAQIKPYDCNIQKEQITKVKENVTTGANIWDSVLGLENADEKYAVAYPLDDGATMIAGTASDKKQEKPVLSLLLLKLDNRGRIEWKKLHTVDGFLKAKAIYPVKSGYIVFADTQGKKGARGWAGIFDESGLIKSSGFIGEGGKQISFGDIMPHGKGFIASTELQDITGQISSHTRLYKMNADGKVVSHKSIVTGSENRVNGLDKNKAGNFIIGAGSISGEDGRTQGWIIATDGDNQIIWQRPYPRGQRAELNKTVYYEGSDKAGKIISAGTAYPAGGGKTAAWIMMVRADNGEIIWQRYFTTDKNLSGHDLKIVSVKPEASSDTMDASGATLSVLVNESGDRDKGQISQGRILSLDINGYLIGSDTYSNADGAVGESIHLNKKNEPVIVGNTHVVYISGKDEKTGVDLPNTDSLDGWVVTIPRPLAYPDPCLNPIQK